MTTDMAINFTPQAAQKVFELIQEEGDPHLNLRVFITGGGCSGFQYGFTFDDSINDDDLVIEQSIQLNPTEEEDDGGDGTPACVKLLVDSMSAEYLKGADIDYREDIHGEQFVIRNPNAKTTCGCGSSFSVD